MFESITINNRKIIRVISNNRILWDFSKNVISFNHQSNIVNYVDFASIDDINSIIASYQLDLKKIEKIVIEIDKKKQITLSIDKQENDAHVRFKIVEWNYSSSFVNAYKNPKFYVHYLN